MRAHRSSDRGPACDPHDGRKRLGAALEGAEGAARYHHRTQMRAPPWSMASIVGEIEIVAGRLCRNPALASPPAMPPRRGTNSSKPTRTEAEAIREAVRRLASGAARRPPSRWPARSARRSPGRRRCPGAHGAVDAARRHSCAEFPRRRHCRRKRTRGLSRDRGTMREPSADPRQRARCNICIVNASTLRDKLIVARCAAAYARLTCRATPSVCWRCLSPSIPMGVDANVHTVPRPRCASCQRRPGAWLQFDHALRTD